MKNWKNLFVKSDDTTKKMSLSPTLNSAFHQKYHYSCQYIHPCSGSNIDQATLNEVIGVYEEDWNLST